MDGGYALSSCVILGESLSPFRAQVSFLLNEASVNL